MKNTLFSFALLAITAVASQAQFSFTTFDGKTVANKNKPSVTLKSLDTTMYYTWEADFVRVQWLTYVGKDLSVDETLVYYVDSDPVMPKFEELPDSGVGADLKSKKGATIPHYNWRINSYYQQMDATTTVMFAAKADATAFFDKLAQKRKSAKAPAKRIVLKKILKEKK